MDCQRWAEGKSLVLVHDSVHPAGILSSKFRGRDRACFDIFYLQFFCTTDIRKGEEKGIEIYYRKLHISVLYYLIFAPHWERF